MKPSDVGELTATCPGPDPNGRTASREADSGNEDIADLTSRLRADQSQRWQAGEKIGAESYFDQYPALRSATEYAVDLIYSEFLVREELGQQPRPEEYLRRFPEFRSELQRQFSLHSELAAAAAESLANLTDNTTATGSKIPAPPDSGHAFGGIAANAVEAPERIGRFEIRQRLGMGAFGCVYRAYDPQLDREVALKVPHPHLLTEGHRERFLREARAAAQLRHSHLVAVYDSGVSASGCFIAYQLVVGQTLADSLKQRAFSASEAASLVCKLAQAAHHAHSQGVFHRDLKTANVLLDEKGEPYISDFGLVRFEGDATLTTEAAVLGTPAYMPPEQAQGASHKADARSDVYTLGIVLYELLTGRLPFSGPPQGVLRQVIEEDPLPVRALNRDAPRDLETICLKAMAKRPADRYATAELLAEDLGRWSRHEPIRARPVALVVRLSKWARRRPAAAALVGVTFLALFAVFILGTWYNLRLRAANLQTRQLLARTKQLLSQSQAERGVQLLEGGDPAGLLYLAAARGTSEGHRQGSESRALLWAGWYEACRGRLVQVLGDDGPVHTAVFTGDNTRLITGSDRGVYLWDVATGARLGDRIPHTQHVPIALDGAAKLLATAPADEAPRLWDTDTGDPLNTQFPAIRNVSALALSRDGSLIAIASGPMVWVGDVATGKFFGEPLRHGGEVGQSMAFSNDGTLLATTARLAEVGVARIWRINRANHSVESVGRPLVHDQEIASVIFSPDSSAPVRVATASRDNSARLWDPMTGEACGDKMRHRESVSVVAFSPDGTLLATGSFDGTARIWNGKTGKPISEPMRHQGPVRTVAFGSDGNLLATGSLDGSVRIWNTLNGTVQKWPLRHLGDVTTVAFSHDNRMLASASAGGSVRIWNVAPESLEAARIFPHHSRIYSLALSRRSGEFIVTGSGDGSVCLWNSESGSLMESWRHSGEVVCVALSPEEDVVAYGPCGPGRNKVELRNVGTGELLDEPLSLRGALQSMAYSPNGKLLATGTVSGTVQIWDVSSDIRRRGRVLQYASEPSNLPITAIAFSPDTQLLAFGSEDQTVRLWNIESMQLHCPPLWHAGPVDAIAFSQDRKRMATVSRDLAIRLWEIAGGQSTVVQTIRAQANVQAMSFSPNGKLLATASADGAVRLWDIETGLPCGLPFAHDAFATAVAFSPDGEWLVTASFDKTARIWRLSPYIGDSNFSLIHLRTVVALGARLDSQGTLESIPWTEWQRLRNELAGQD